MSAYFSGLQSSQSGPIEQPVKSPPSVVYATSATAAGTFTTQQISGGELVVYNHTGASPGSKTLPTVAVLVAEDPYYALSKSYRLRVVNNQKVGSLTIVTATGWTLSGSVVVPPMNSNEYLITYNSATAATLLLVNVNYLIPGVVASFAANAVATSSVLTTAQVCGADNVNLEVTDNSPGTKTTPDAADWIAADALFVVGRTYLWSVTNVGSGALALGLGDSVTNSGVAGDLNIATTVGRVYMVTYTSATEIALRYLNTFTAT